MLRCSRQGAALSQLPAGALLSLPSGDQALHPPGTQQHQGCCGRAPGSHHHPAQHRLLVHTRPVRPSHSKERLSIPRQLPASPLMCHPPGRSQHGQRSPFSSSSFPPYFSSLSFPPSPKSSLSLGSAEEADLLKINSFCFDLVYGHALFIAPCVRLDTFPPAAPATASYHSHFGY